MRFRKTRDLASYGIIPTNSKSLESLYPDLISKNGKLLELTKAGRLIRLKRGLYVVSPQEHGLRLSQELLANHIYTPSYVSMLSALRYHHFIPEIYPDDERYIQSLTVKHTRSFENQLGYFEYTKTDAKYFMLGVQILPLLDTQILMASPEKALCDLVAHTDLLNLRYLPDAKHYLLNDLMISEESCLKFDCSIFEKYIATGGKKAMSIKKIIEYLKKNSDL